MLLKFSHVTSDIFSFTYFNCFEFCKITMLIKPYVVDLEFLSEIRIRTEIRSGSDPKIWISGGAESGSE